MKFHSNPIISEDIHSIISAHLPWEDFSGKTILISGANGFLPAYMVYTLLALNDSRGSRCKVIALVRNKERGEKRFADYLGRPDFNLLVQDVSVPFRIEERLDYVIHAASQASPRYYGIDPVGTLRANVSGTLNLLENASACGAVRFMFFSSSEVYGALPVEKMPAEETEYGSIDPTNVRACYAESKRMGETISVSWMHQFGLPAVIVRPFHTYGPGMALDDGRVYADFISNIVNGQDITMNSDGSAVRAFCYIEDATLAFFSVLLKGQPGQAYNVGNDLGECSIIGLAEKLVSLYPHKGLKINRFEPKGNHYIKSLVSRIVPDISKIKALGWNPEFSIEKGFDRTINSYL